jgi:hypothetical protein
LYAWISPVCRCSGITVPGSMRSSSTKPRSPAKKRNGLDDLPGVEEGTQCRAAAVLKRAGR